MSHHVHATVLTVHRIPVFPITTQDTKEKQTAAVTARQAAQHAKQLINTAVPPDITVHQQMEHLGVQNAHQLAHPTWATMQHKANAI